jgi:nuclear transport factor 2 (NTF2) superfamily protein
MPESKCDQCGIVLKADTEKELMKKEVEHYNASKAPDYLHMRGSHQCFDFIQDEKGFCIRSYGNGEWEYNEFMKVKAAGRIKDI